jgi:hypothetical protein
MEDKFTKEDALPIKIEAAKEKRQEACEKLQKKLAEYRKLMDGDEYRSELDSLLWETLLLFEGCTFHTFKGLEFQYTVRGGEVFISRKEHSKSLTKSSILMAFHTGVELQFKEGCVKGPKKLGTFGASYMYPMFVRFGIINF